MMDLKLNEKVALITGGGRGIGKGIARRLVHEGMRVIIGDVDGPAGEETVSEYRPWGSIEYVMMDVAGEASVRHAVQLIVERHGRLDALVNNAGIANPVNRPVEELELEDWNRVITVNLTGQFLCAKHAVPHLRKSGGSIVNVASTRALQSEPHTEAYSASKGGIVALTHALAMSLSPDVRVNCVSPGWIEVGDWKKAADRKIPNLTAADHAQHPSGRVGKPDDVAAMVAFLLSDQAGFMTGQNMIVDGGMTRKMIYVD